MIDGARPWAGPEKLRHPGENGTQASPTRRHPWATGPMGKGWIVAFFLLGLPLLLADSFLARYVDLSLGALEDRRFRNLEAFQQGLVKLKEPETLILRTLNRLVLRAERSPDRLKKVTALARGLAKRYPRLFSFNVFGPDGGIRFRWGDDASPELPMRVRDLLHYARLKGKNPGFAGFPELARYLGQRQRFQRCDGLVSRNWLDVSKRSWKSWAFFHDDPEFSLLVHVHKGGFDPLIGIRHSLGRRNPRAQLRVNIVDLDTLSPLSCSDEEYFGKAAQVIARVNREPVTRLIQFGRIWSVDRIDSRYLLLCSFPHAAATMRSNRLVPFRLAGAILFLLGWTTAAILMGMARGPAVSLRWKLLGLFLVVGGLPGLILAFLGETYIRVQEGARMMEVEEGARTSLENFEERFPQAFRLCERWLDRVLRAESGKIPRWLERLCKPLRDFLEAHSCNSVYMVGTRHPTIVLKRGNETEESGKLRIFTQFLQVILRQVRGELRQRDQVFIMQLGIGAEQTLGMDFEQLMNHYLSNEGRIVPMSFGSTESFTCIRTLPVEAREKETILAAHWSTGDLENLYFSRNLPMKPFESGTEIVLVRWKGWEGLTRIPPSRVPVKFKGKPFSTIHRDFPHLPGRPLGAGFWGFFERLRSRQQKMGGRIQYKNQSCLVYGIPGTRFPGYGLFAITPLTSVRKDVALLEKRLGGLVAAFAAFAAFLGIMLSRQFLQPVRAMAEAVEAVRDKRFDRRVPASSDDELGILGTRFNVMLSGLAEMVDAKLVQQELLPKIALEAGPFRVFGHSVTTSDLGGDYFDYLVLPEDRLLVLHGDVTGHGVGAALVMAMVKGIVNHLGHAGVSGPALVNSLSGVVNRVTRRELMMTLGVLDMDIRTGKMTLYNCGNPFPFIVCPDGSAKEIEAAGKLVGFSPSLSVVPASFELMPGERLVFYSDGLVEPLAAFSQDPYGEFLRLLVRLRTLPIQDFCREVIRQHPVCRLEGRFPDDTTVVAVEICEGVAISSGGNR